MERRRFELALQEGRTGLVRLAEQMKEAGASQTETYEVFERFRAELRDQGREADEDIVMDVMDRVTGWCDPTARLFADGR